MHIEQFYDKGLAHASYAIVEGNEVILIDPARDASIYLDFALRHKAKIVGVIETHPHADFVSSHLEIHQGIGATIYCSSLLAAEYPHQAIDQMEGLAIGNYWLRALSTPGHSPDSVSIVLSDAENKDVAVFTGDTLFVGDVGRPDLRENVGHITAEAKTLAAQLYGSLRDKLMPLDDDVLVYPAHGAGSLCGKNISDERSSTIGRERASNYAVQEMSEAAFVALILKEQPYVPHYFPYDVALNKAGAERLEDSLSRVVVVPLSTALEASGLFIDISDARDFRRGHLPNSINVPDGDKFETWVGSIVPPGESFYLLAESEEKARQLLLKLAKIGYEKQTKGIVVKDTIATNDSPSFDLDEFKKDPAKFTIVDIRNDSEVKQGKVFANAISLPLPRLRESVDLLPTDKPIVVHCAGGYRSAIGTSIIARQIHDVPVLDMGKNIDQFQ